MVATATPITTAASSDAAAIAIVQLKGSCAHSYPNAEALRGGRGATRNLADAIHHLTLLHGRQPSVVDYAALHTVHSGTRDWLLHATSGFAHERNYLTKLAVAVGPLPSTPGQAETESAVLAQHHALDMLAQSDRIGCAFGAAAALVLDWQTIREILDHAAGRLGVTIAGSALPSIDATQYAISAIAETPAVERAISFGAQQLLSQHHGLWDLLQARHVARGSE